MAGLRQASQRAELAQSAFVETCGEVKSGEMSNVVNLKKFRKRKAKLAKESRAETNRRLHGRTLAERAQELAQKRKLLTQVDGARLETSTSEEQSE